MNGKIRVPKLRSVLLAMVIVFCFVLLISHQQSKVERSARKATGLSSGDGASTMAQQPSSMMITPTEHVAGVGPGRGGGIVAGIVGGVPGGYPAAGPILDNDSKSPNATYLQEGGGGGGDTYKVEKKLIRTVTLNLLVKEARAASLRVQQIAQTTGGDVERAELRNIADSSPSGEITFRVPADQLESAVENLRHIALRVQTEHWESNDVTREFMDSEARLRNMKAEEQQYLALLRRAGSMKDTLQVTEKISEVRGEIEQLQGELNWMSHQVAMSAIHVSLSEEPQAVVAATWRPLYNARHNAHEMLLGLGEWVDWVVAFVIDIPLMLVWAFSIGIVLWVAWRVLRFIWLRWLKPRVTPEPATAS